MDQNRAGTRLCEILHIDTEDSQRFFIDHKATEREKCNCQIALGELFTVCCRTFGGLVKFEGDGGIAYFDQDKFSGGSVRAAEKFLAELPKFHKQLRRLLPNRKILRRQRFRLKGHFGRVYFDKKGERATSDARVIDSLVKKERNIAVLADQLYITQQLLDVLDHSIQRKFSPAGSRPQKFGHLVTVIHRLQKRPPDSIPRPPVTGKRSGRKTLIRVKDLDFLKRSVESQLIQTTARNLITMSLTHQLGKSRRPLKGDDLVRATLQGIHAFLVLSSSDITETFNVTFWRPDSVHVPKNLKKQCAIPEAGQKRTVSLTERKYQVVRSFTECTAIFHDDVRAAFANKEWIYFDGAQGRKKRNLYSAAQFPVYWPRNLLGKPLNREVVGVLSVDTNVPDFFQQSDAPLWVDRIKGFLANLALSQVLQR